MALHAHSVCLPPDASYPFHVTAKRYAHPRFERRRHMQAQAPLPVTLLLLHSTSFHKEIFEPVLATLFAHASVVPIREAWAVECPNHGESAVWNASLLNAPPYDEYFSCERYAEAVYRFVQARGVDGPYIRTDTDRIVCVGHSLGGCAGVFLSAKMSFSSLILVDPFLYPGGEPEKFAQMRDELVRSAHGRRDVWETREGALQYLNRGGRRGWDLRVMKLYVEYGIREHPHSARSVSPYTGVTLACTREQEATMYRDPEGAFKPIQQLDRVCKVIPVHIAFGDKSDVIPRNIQNNIVDRRVRSFASIEWIQGITHLVPQQAPDAVATFINDALAQNEKALAKL